MSIIVSTTGKTIEEKALRKFEASLLGTVILARDRQQSRSHSQAWGFRSFLVRIGRILRVVLRVLCGLRSLIGGVLRVLRCLCGRICRILRSVSRVLRRVIGMRNRNMCQPKDTENHSEHDDRRAEYAIHRNAYPPIEVILRRHLAHYGKCIFIPV